MELNKLSDHELVAAFGDLVIDERERLALQLEYIAELDRRKLFFHYQSLRSYLVEEHGMEESAAERKIRAARLFKRFPEIKGMIESGKLNLTLLELALGCAHREKLSDPELAEILGAIAGKTCQAAMREIVSRFPETYIPPKDRIRPLTAELSEVRFVASHELLEKLEEIRGLLAHSHPRSLTMGELIDVLATEYRERHHPEEKAKRAKEREAKKKQTEKVEMVAATRARMDGAIPLMEEGQSQTRANRDASPHKQTRIANSAIVHELTIRHGYQCSYVDDVTEMRCYSKYGLEKDHIQSWSTGGGTELSNLRYLCVQHHQRISFLEFGESSKYFTDKRE